LLLLTSNNNYCCFFLCCGCRVASPVRKLDDVMEPIAAELVGVLAQTPAEERASWEAEGLRLISQGKCAVVLLAGGQVSGTGSNPHAALLTTHP